MSSCEKEFTFEDLKTKYKTKNGFDFDENSFWVEYNINGNNQYIIVHDFGYTNIVDVDNESEIAILPEGTSFNRIDYILNALLGG